MRKITIFRHVVEQRATVVSARMLYLYKWLVGGDASVFGHAVEERTSVSQEGERVAHFHNPPHIQDHHAAAVEVVSW